MYEIKKLESYLRVNLLGPSPRLMKKKNLPGRGLTKVEKHWPMLYSGPEDGLNNLMNTKISCLSEENLSGLFFCSYPLCILKYTGYIYT